MKNVCFNQIDPKKKSLAKAMLNKNVYIVYQPKEKNIVKDMELTS